MSDIKAFEADPSRVIFSSVPDVEAKAIVTCVESLDCLTDAPRQRVLGYLTARYGDPAQAPEVTSTATETSMRCFVCEHQGKGLRREISGGAHTYSCMRCSSVLQCGTCMAPWQDGHVPGECTAQVTE